MYCPRIKFWYTSIQTKLWYWLVARPTLELEQSWFIAVRMEASVQLPTCTRLSLLQKESTVNPQGSAVHRIWPDEVLPVPVRTSVHTGDRS